jgi:CubicO group peptidase (beta-lactamase class C family)
MTVDTIFDLASLTKVVATTSSLMKLFEEGKFRLNDRVTQYLPEFQEGKSEITIRNLFTHFSGLPPDNFETAVERLSDRHPPGHDRTAQAAARRALCL